jgi:hypothetical protein
MPFHLELLVQLAETAPLANVLLKPSQTAASPSKQHPAPATTKVKSTVVWVPQL